MYEGDPYYPVSEPSDSEYDETVSVISGNRRNPIVDAYRATDKGYYKTKRLIGGKMKTVEFYSTPTTPGAIIRDAIHGGLFVKSRVGSPHENLFYKVRMCTVKPNVSGDSVTLFFDNPEQCERHMGITIDQAEKERWSDKYNIAHFGKAIQ
jgi:hypothetical protein